MATASSISRLLRLLPCNYKHPFTIPTIPFFSTHSFSSIPPNRLRRRLQQPKTFTFSDSDSDSDSNDEHSQTPTPTPSKLPPPYNPFNKTPIIQEPQDPSDLQQIFHNMRTEGFQNHAIKMFDALSRDGLTHEALDLFRLIQEKGSLPDVVAHTAVIEAYSNAGGGHSKQALKVFLRMLSAGVNPNAYTYTVLIKGLVTDLNLKDASKYLLEMMGRGIKPNAKTYTSVFEAFVSEGKMDEARGLLVEMKGKGFKPDEDAVRDNLTKRGQVFTSVIDLLFNS